MRILSFSHDAFIAGAQRSLITLLRGLRDRGHRVMLVIPGNGPLADVARDEDVDHFVLRPPYPYPSRKPLRILRFFRTLPGAARSIRAVTSDFKPHVIHFNSSACIAPALSLRRFPAPRVWHVREIPPARQLVAGRLFAWADHVVFNCRFVSSAFALTGRSGRFDIVHNGLDVPSFPSDEPGEIREHFGWKPDEKVLLFAGQLRPHKDPVAVIEAVSHCRDRGLPVRGCLAGSGPLEPFLRNEILTRGLEKWVHVIGFRDPILPLVAAADIVSCTSLVEPFPRTVLEAMALKRPIVATSAGGTPEMVTNEIHALLVTPGDRPAFVEAVARLASDQKLAIHLAHNAYARHQQDFRADVYVSRMESILMAQVDPAAKDAAK